MSATPGPWSLDRYGSVVGPDGRDIRVHGLTLTSSDEAKANTRLIAAAPELLEALESLLFDADQFAKVIPPYQNAESIVKARAAIAKATETTR